MLEAAVKNTILENTQFNVQHVKAKGECRNCGKIFEMESFFTPCPDCKNHGAKIIQGREIRVKSLLID